jgi:hypothetical protein
MKTSNSNFLAKCASGLCIAFAAIILFSTLLPAQTFYGSIVGIVSDSSGGVIPGASVSLTNLGTAENRGAVTDSNGNYRFVNLIPGRYRLEIEAVGFKRLARESISVEIEAAVRIDAVLQVGNISETVSVSSDTPLLQTESSSVSQVIEGRHVLEMPLNGRNSMNLIALAPGVVSQGSTSGATLGNQQGTSSGSHTNNMGWGNYQIGGSIAGLSATFLDGSPLNVGGGGNSIALVATQDAVQEFRVVSNSVSAEFGRFGGGVVNMTTKSGANEFHGSAYEYLRNKVLNANNFFSNATGMPKPAWVQNQYGVTLGGPVKKDKTFFFFSWEDFRLRFGVPALNSVPTAKQIAGDFSGSAPIYDPLTTKTVNGVVTRTQFQNNLIPANRIDYTANVIANVQKYWPLPNTSQPGGNFASTSPSGGDQSQYNVRIDHNLSDRQRLFGRFTYWSLSDISFNPMLNGTGNPPSNNRTHHFVVGDTYAFSPTTVADLRVSYLRQYYDDLPPSRGTDLKQFGPSWASLNDQVVERLLPKPSVSGLYGFGPMQSFSLRYWNNYALSASLTKILGRHTFKFGGEVRLLDNNSIQSKNLTGTFSFNTAFTSANGTTTSSAGGNAFASFLLGYPYAGSIQTAQWVAQFSWYQGYYFTDTFEVSRKLTLNYGLRWELPGALAEKHDLATVLLPDAVDPLSQPTGMKLTGQLGLVNSSQWPDRTVQEVKHGLFAPRVGFAYRITNQTVLRGGYGISYLPNNSAAASNVSEGSPLASPINLATSNMDTSQNNTGLIPLNTLSNPFPAGGVTGTVKQEIIYPPGRSSSFMNTLEGGTVSAMIPDQPYPYVQQWNLTLGHQLPGNTLIELSYAGAKSTHLPFATLGLNQLPAQYFSMGSALLTPVKNPFYGLLPPTSTLSKATISQGQLLRPYPQFLNFNWAGAQTGDTNYHAMMLKVEKRFGEGGRLIGSYSWAKMIGTADTVSSSVEYGGVGAVQDNDNIRAERSLISHDVPHRLVVSYVLDLPFGKGKRFLSGTSGFAGKLLSGWGINGVTSFQSGFPLKLTAQATTLSSSFGAGTPRPNVVAGCEQEISGSAQSKLGKWFNTACFTQPGSYSFGNEARVNPRLRAHGVNNFDFAVFKSTGITERVNLQFRTEFFNLFNRVQFYSPATALGVSTFGTVNAQLNQPRLVQFAMRLTF